MRTRKEILIDLLNFDSKINVIKKEISRFNWDVEEALVLFSKDHLVSCLKKVLDHHINLSELEEWANVIEGRDDIEFTDSYLKQLIVELANPYLYGEISYPKIEKMIMALNDKWQ